MGVQGKENPPGVTIRHFPEKGGKLRELEGSFGVNYPTGRLIQYKILYIVCQGKNIQYIVIYEVRPQGCDPSEFSSCHGASGKKAAPVNILEGFVKVVVILNHVEGEV
jgi:hypothetical protein